MSFKNKRVLLLAANLFGYHDEIKRGLERLGAHVDYFDERPANSFMVKAAIRINRNLLAPYLDRYHNKIIDSTHDTPYDYILVIKGESLSAKTVKRLKVVHPCAKLVIYLWDSIANNVNALRILSLFDRVFSFDKFDCERWGINFLPLFYLPEYAAIVQREPDYDLVFVGTTHSDRYHLVHSVVQQITAIGGRCFTYFFSPNRILYYRMKLLNKHVRTAHTCDFHFKALSKREMFDLFSRAKTTIDTQHPRQTGLTMRCIEALGAKRKLITTNHHIRNYDFFREQNILVIDRKHPVIPVDFLNTPYEELPDSIYRKYSLESWLDTLFN